MCCGNCFDFECWQIEGVVVLFFTSFKTVKSFLYLRIGYAILEGVKKVLIADQSNFGRLYHCFESNPHQLVHHLLHRKDLDPQGLLTLSFTKYSIFENIFHWTIQFHFKSLGMLIKSPSACFEMFRSHLFL